MCNFDDQTTVRRHTYATQAKQIEQTRRQEDKRTDSLHNLRHHNLLDAQAEMEVRAAEKRSVRVAIQSQQEMEMEESIHRVR